MRRSLFERISAVVTAITLVAVSIAAFSVSASATATPLDAVQVTGGFGAAPSVLFAKPFSVSSNAQRTLIEGTGVAATSNDRLIVDFLLIDGRTGRQVNNSFGSQQPPNIVLDPKQSITGIVTALTGVRAGSRVMIALSPTAGVAKNLSKFGVRRSDTLLFLFDVLEVHARVTRAEGAVVAPTGGFPAVTFSADGTPTILKPTGEPPTTVQVEQLVTGAGPVVRAGQTLELQLAGIIWATGRQFQSTWKRGDPKTVTIGTGESLVGWDQGLVGQPIGSRVLLVVPPFEGFGASGQPEFGIGSNDTLVYVIDILDAH